MSLRPFDLQPFPGKPIPDGLKVSGEIGRRGPVLDLHYELAGPLHELVLPPPASLPERRFALWESTCCEFFLAPVPGEANSRPPGTSPVQKSQGSASWAASAGEQAARFAGHPISRGLAGESGEAHKERDLPQTQVGDHLPGGCARWEPAYWEFNLSPAGHWNAFRFSGYRQGMEKETALTALPVSVEGKADRWRLSLSADLTGLGIGSEPWCLALSVVLADRNGGISYWALVHPAPEADFHHRGGFQVELP